MQSQLRYFHTCVLSKLFSQLEVYCGFFSNYHRTCMLPSCKRMGSSLCPSLFHRLWPSDQPLNQIFIIDWTNHPSYYNQIHISISRFLMKSLFLISVLFFVEAFNFSLFDFNQAHQTTKLRRGEQIRYSGKGFGVDLQSAFAQAIEDSVIFYKYNYYSQAHYISKSMQKVKAGKWNVFVFHDVNITRITEVSTGFSYWNEGDTWALWYSITSLTNNFLHLIIYNGVSNRSYANVTTSQCMIGNGVKDKADVIASIVSHSDTVKDIASSLQKYDQQKWSVISIPVLLGGIYPEGYGVIFADQSFVSYHQNVTMLKEKYSQIIYV